LPPTARRNLVGAALLALLLPLALARVAHATPAGPPPLRPLDERTLGFGESRNYFFPMEAGEYLRIDVEQNDDIDAGIRLYDSQGKLLFHGNSYTGTHGAETMSWIAEKAEVLRVEVYAWEEFDGRFRASVDGPRSPTAYDTRRTQATRELFEGIRLEELQPEPLYAQAEEHHRRAVALWAGLAETRWSVLAQRHLAYVLTKQGEVAEGYLRYRSIWPILLELKEIELIPEAACRIIQYLVQAGDVSEFEHFTEPALAGLSAQLPGAAANRADCLAFEAIRIGRLETAIEFLRFRIKVLSSAGDRSALPDALQELSRVLRRMGRLDEALQVTKREYRLSETPQAEARALVAQALTQIGLGKPQFAIQTLAEIKQPTALPLAVQAEFAYANGWANFDAANYVSASEYFSRSSELRPRGPDSAASWAFLALSEIKRGQLSLARDAMSRALEFPLLADAGTRAFVHRVEAEFFYAEGRLQEAMDRLQLSLTEMEKQRSDSASEALRVSFWSTRSQHLEAAINLLLSAANRQNDERFAEQAFMIVDDLRAPTLRERLQRASYRQLEPTLDVAASRPEVAQLDRKIASLTQRRPPQWREIKDSFSRRRAEVLLSAALRRRHNRQQLSSRSPDWNLKELQAQLGPDEQFISFFLGKERSYVWILDRGRLELVSLPPRAEIERVALALSEAASESRLTGGEERLRIAAADFSNIVWRRFSTKIWARNLHISPDGALYRVPFAAVEDPENPGKQLVDRLGLSIAPSLSTISAIRSRERRCSGTGLVSNSGPTGDFSKDGPALSRFRAEFATIPATRASILSGSLGPFCHLHFATHGSADSSWPDSSALIADDGVTSDSIYAFEIRELELSADLVVLAACESGAGEVRGEGLYGLSSAFLGAGAAQVLASLWPVDSQATSELMASFYSALGQGLEPTFALREAQMDLRSRPGRESLAFWGAFQIIGAPDH
jgi:tetratricopeptide (TPR) repeat protein